ncbi:MAG: DUF4118 domain-containing protein [Polyangiales bacterium]
MAADPTRPDPDALLARLNAEESRARQGRLRVFFGFAPGVGKTFRMLQVARTLVEEGSDVVVGVIETHGRYDTASLMLGLDLLPPRVVEYRGRRLTDFDLDAALARRPGVVLVDELAHTNAPGSRHPKRWQDVIELVEAGVDVFTTLNVQHVESLNDVVAQITGARVRETVPDEVLARADLVELVDISPEELLERLREGRVYLRAEAARATQHFFRRGNLLALRELALRRVAERVDVDVQAWRAQEGVGATWHTAERILVCVGPSPSSGRLVRAGRRMAAGMRAPWIAAWVEPAGGLSAANEARLDAHLAMAEALGAEVARLQGPSVPAAILGYARRRNVTRIVIGKATHTRWRDLVRGSLLDEVVRGSGEIDVLVITGDEAPSEAEARRATREGSRSSAVGYVGAAAMVTLATGVTWFARALLAAPDLVMIYLLVVAGVAMRFGRGPSLLAAGLSVVAYDVFFVPPYFTLAVADGRHALTFAMMFAAGLVLSSLTERIRRQEQSARDREARTAALLALSRDLGSGASEREVLTALVERASQVFATPVAAWMPTAEGGLVAAVTTGGGSTAEIEPVARWCFEHGRPAGAGTDTLPGQSSLCVPMRGATAVLGVLSMEQGGALGHARRDLLDAFVRQGSLALERVRLAESAHAASVRACRDVERSAEDRSV